MNNKFSFTGIEGASDDKEKAEIIILPVPYDETSTWIKGADKAPGAIIEASRALELYDIETDSKVYKKGIFTMPFLSVDTTPENMTKIVEQEVLALLRSKKFVVLLGGEHSVSIGAIRANSEKFNNISILHLDAHLDMRDTYEGSKFNHACISARASECCPVVHVGVRSVSPEEKDCFKMKRNNIFLAKDVINNAYVFQDIVAKLTDNVYITVDMDVFDPSLIPATGTPEPGGLFWYDVINLLKEVARTRTITGFDVVELCPIENNKAPNFGS